MNEENLVSLADRTTEERREIAKKGGIASGETRRRKKTMREAMDLLLSLPLKDEELREKAEQYGINHDDIDNQMVMVIAQWQEASKGNPSAYNNVQATLGEKPKEIMEVTNIDGTIAEVEKYLGDKQCKINEST